jgi:hypothetical protein
MRLPNVSRETEIFWAKQKESIVSRETSKNAFNPKPRTLIVFASPFVILSPRKPKIYG